MSPKKFWIIAGGNGSGKSNFYNSRMKASGLPFVNADEIGLTQFTKNGKTDAAKASREAQKQVYKRLENGESFCYETVFSHVSKIDIVAKAKGLGYEINIIFIHLDNPDLNEARVYQRVKNEDGHDVPSEKIRGRIPRTLENIEVALKLADNALLFDNSWGWDNPYKLIALKEDGKWTVQIEKVPDWAQKLMD